MLDRSSKPRLIAFHGDAAVKAFYLDRLRRHVRDDELTQGVFAWKGSKSGVVGCTIHGDDHSRYEVDLGIPEVLAYLEEIVFERLPNNEAKRFAVEFLEAIPVGADLSLVWPTVAHWLLLDPGQGVIGSAQTDETRSAIEQVASLYGRMVHGEQIEVRDFRNAVQSAGPLGEGQAAQVVCGAAEAASDAAEIAGWTVGKAWSSAPEEMWLEIKRRLLQLLRQRTQESGAVRSMPLTAGDRD